MQELPWPETFLPAEWQVVIKEGIRDVLEQFVDGDLDLVSFSPRLISDGLDDRMWYQLPKNERDFITEVLFKEIGFSRSHSIIEREYTMKSPPPNPEEPEKLPTWSGQARVIVYRTQRWGEGVYLHEIHRKGLEVEYFVTGADFKL